MMNRPSTKKALLLIVSGVLASYLWVWLFGVWAVYDTPLLKLGQTMGLGVPLASRISLSLFCLLCAAFFTVPLRLFYRHSFFAAAIIFIASFLLAFFGPMLAEGEATFLFSFSTLWLFILFFAACVLLAARFHHA